MENRDPSPEERNRLLQAALARMDPETFLLPEDQQILDRFGQTHKALAALESVARQALALTEDPEVKVRIEAALCCARLIPTGIVADVKTHLLQWHLAKN